MIDHIPFLYLPLQILNSFIWKITKFLFTEIFLRYFFTFLYPKSTISYPVSLLFFFWRISRVFLISSNKSISINLSNSKASTSCSNPFLYCPRPFFYMTNMIYPPNLISIINTSRNKLSLIPFIRFLYKNNRERSSVY